MILDTAEICIKHEISLFFGGVLFCFWLQCRTHTCSLCGQEGSRSKRDTRCNKYGGAKECWFLLLLLWEWHPQLCFFQTWWWKINNQEWKTHTHTHFHKNAGSPAAAQDLCARLLWHLNGGLIHFRQFVVEAFKKKISSVYKVCCQLSSSDLHFFFFLLLSDLQFIHPMRRCAKHTAMSLLREFQLLPEPSVWVNKWKNNFLLKWKWTHYLWRKKAEGWTKCFCCLFRGKSTYSQNGASLKGKMCYVVKSDVGFVTFSLAHCN